MIATSVPETVVKKEKTKFDKAYVLTQYSILPNQINGFGEESKFLLEG